MTMPDKTIFTIVINGNSTAGFMDRFTDLGSAIREWNRLTFNDPSITGGIEVKEWIAGLVVRDGWIIRVREANGRAYLNPNLALA